MPCYSIDINCDLGEGKTLADCDQDAHLMPFISSCNIACGGHAGNYQTMRKTIDSAIQNDLNIGAHPGYPDPENFGRVSLDLPVTELIASIDQQIASLDKVANEMGIPLNHIKLHGALYNDVEKDSQLACAFADYFKRQHKEKYIFALAHGQLLREAQSNGLQTIAEGFMDRRYTSQRQLTPRNIPGAVIESSKETVSQALALAQGRKLNSIEGMPILIAAETICLHGDNPKAARIAKLLVDTLRDNGVNISKSGAKRD
ncbi:MAG: 5-oxoprolinase subunit PxpA [Kangiellaceae bacterium]|nr:5-oxoprolinase subunit PxpA [Kangiellaceae bacterium]